MFGDLSIGALFNAVQQIEPRAAQADTTAPGQGASKVAQGGSVDDLAAEKASGGDAKEQLKLAFEHAIAMHTCTLVIQSVGQAGNNMLRQQ